MSVMVLDSSLFHSTSWMRSYASSASWGGAATAPCAYTQLINSSNLNKIQARMCLQHLEDVIQESWARSGLRC